MDVIRGKYHLGKVVVDGLDFVAVREKDGSLNFAHLAKTQANEQKPSTPQEKGPSSPQPPQEKKKLPEVQVDLVLQNCRGTIEDRLANQTAYLRSLDGDLNIPDINSPITETIKAVLALGQNQPGTLAIDGTTLLVKNNQLMSDPAEIINDGNIQQKIALADLNLASLAPFLGHDSGIQQIEGIASGQININLKAKQNGAIDGHLNVANIKASGPALKGDTLDAQAMDIVISPTAIELAPSGPGVTGARILTGSADGKQPIAITLVQRAQNASRITFFADVTTQSLSNLASHKKPGDAGRIELTADIDVGHLATAMPHVFAVSPGVAPTSGTLRETTSINLTADKCDFQNHGELAPVTLVRTSSGAPSPEPVLADYSLTFDADGSIVAAGGNQSINISKLAVIDNKNFLSVGKTADAIVVGLAPDGSIYPTGRIEIASDLKAVNDLLRRLAPPAEGTAAPRVVVKTDQGLAVRDGKLTGSLAFAPGAAQHFLLSTQLQIAGLTIDKAGATPLQNEKLTALLDATVRNDVSQIEIGRFDIMGSLVTAHADKTTIQLKQGEGKDAVAVPLPLMVQNASLAVDVPSLAKMQAVLDAFSPPAPTAPPTQARSAAPLAEMYAAAGEKLTPPAATQPVAKPKAKVNLTSGAMAMNIAIVNDGKQVTITPQVTGRDIAFEAVRPIGKSSTTSVRSISRLLCQSRRPPQKRLAPRPQSQAQGTAALPDGSDPDGAGGAARSSFCGSRDHA